MKKKDEKKTDRKTDAFKSDDKLQAESKDKKKTGRQTDNERCVKLAQAKFIGN